jgi:hypothetical protein
MKSTRASSAIETTAARATLVSAHRILVRSRHFGAAGILSLALLAPFPGGIVPLLQRQGSSCGMSCCLESKTCCCHSSEAADQAGSVWTAAPACPGGCGQHPGLPGSLAVALAPNGIAVGQVAQCNSLPDCPTESLSRAYIEFALFERPPPVISTEFHQSAPAAARPRA